MTVAVLKPYLSLFLVILVSSSQARAPILRLDQHFHPPDNRQSLWSSALFTQSLNRIAFSAGVDSINNMFQLQYKQYQAYRENSEILDHKVHDLKHQLAIIQQEPDKTKKEQYLEEISEVIQTLDAKR